MRAISNSTAPELPASANEDGPVTNRDDTAPEQPAEGNKPLLRHPRPAPVMRRSLFRR